MKERKYSDQINIDNEQKLRALVAELPRFCREYFIGIEPSTSSRTRIAYALAFFSTICMKIMPQWRKWRLLISPLTF